MYFLRKFGPIFLTILILLCLTLALVILLYRYNGVLLPTFSFPSENAVNRINDSIKFLSIGGTLK